MVHWTRFLVGVLVLTSCCSTVYAAALKEGRWSMTMVTKMKMDPARQAEMDAAMKEMENLPPEAKAMMQKMQGSMGMKMDVSAQGGGITTTITQCLSDKSPVPNMNSSNNKCEETHQVMGNTVTFSAVCNEKNSKSESSGKMTYAGDTMKGQIKSHQVSRGETVDATIDISGKYLGPCK